MQASAITTMRILHSIFFFRHAPTRNELYALLCTRFAASHSVRSAPLDACATSICMVGVDLRRQDAPHDALEYDAARATIAGLCAGAVGRME